MRIKAVLTAGMLGVLSLAIYWWFMGTDPQLASLTSGSMEVSIYRNYKLAGKGRLTPESAGAKAIRSLLARKTGNWRRSYFDYTHDELFFVGSGFTLDVQRRLAIINFTSPRWGPITLVTSLSPAEYAAVRGPVLNSMETRPLPY